MSLASIRASQICREAAQDKGLTKRAVFEFFLSQADVVVGEDTVSLVMMADWQGEQRAVVEIKRSAGDDYMVSLDRLAEKGAGVIQRAGFVRGE